MSTEDGSTVGTQTFCLSGDVSVRDVRQTHAALCEAIVAEGPLEIDASQLTSTDTAVVQLLLATRRLLPGAVIKLPLDRDVRELLTQIGAESWLTPVTEDATSSAS